MCRLFDKGKVLSEDHPVFLHVGRLEQQLQRLNQQIHQLALEIDEIGTLANSVQISGPDSLNELRHGLQAEILRLNSELNECETELTEQRALLEKVVEGD